MSDVAPGWHPDPYGRHQLRFWDGAKWSEHVSDNGVSGTDADIPDLAGGSDAGGGGAAGTTPVVGSGSDLGRATQRIDPSLLRPPAAAPAAAATPAAPSAAYAPPAPPGAAPAAGGYAPPAPPGGGAPVPPPGGSSLPPGSSAAAPKKGGFPVVPVVAGVVVAALVVLGLFFFIGGGDDGGDIGTTPIELTRDQPAVVLEIPVDRGQGLRYLVRPLDDDLDPVVALVADQEQADATIEFLSGVFSEEIEDFDIDDDEFFSEFFTELDETNFSDVDADDLDLDPRELYAIQVTDDGTSGSAEADFFVAFSDTTYQLLIWDYDGERGDLEVTIEIRDETIDLDDDDIADEIDDLTSDDPFFTDPDFFSAFSDFSDFSS